MHPVQHRSQGRIVGGEQPPGLRLHRKMQIAHRPAGHRRRLRSRVERNLQHRLRLLLDDVGASLQHLHHLAVHERHLEFEAEFRAVVRPAAPQPFRQRAALHADRNRGWGASVGCGQRSSHKVHGVTLPEFPAASNPAGRSVKQVLG